MHFPLAHNRWATMPNSITTDQNTEEALDRLGAQRDLYSRAKWTFGVQTTLAVPVALGWSVAANVFPTVRLWAALWGLGVSLLDAAVLDQFQNSFRQMGAKVQELFDCGVLRLSWNDIKVGPRIDPELIVEASGRHRRKDPTYSRLHDWYPTPVAKLPLPIARIVCQRTNLWWDSRLRQRYTSWLISVLGGSAALAFILGLVYGMTLERFVLAILAPLTPALLWGIRECRRQKSAATLSERLKSHIDGVWEKILRTQMEDSELETEARQLQDEIYERRRTSPLIFNWIYSLLRTSYDEQATKGAEALVQEVLSRP
jgi:hypothetical protein